MRWPDFAVRLDTVLRRLAADPGLDTTVVISRATQPLAYVQFIVNEGAVYAEVSSSKKYLAKELRLSAGALDVLRDAGWTKPGRGDRHGNWIAEIEAGVGHDLARLAEMCVIALRDVWRVPEPSALVYQAFRSASGTDVALDDLALAREPNG